VTRRRPASKPARRSSYETRPFPMARQMYSDLMATAKRKNIIHGLVEVDVTDAHRMLKEQRTNGIDLSFTAFLIYAVAQAVQEDRILHAYRRGRQLLLFDDIDVNTQIETHLNDRQVMKSVVIQAANRKSVEELSREIRASQAEKPPSLERRFRAFMTLPRPVRSLVWRIALSNPERFVRRGGTVFFSSVGMFGPHGGWGIPLAPPTLMITAGGITTKPRYVAGHLEAREVLDLTISVDHDIVDGAPAARFARRLTELIERAHGLAPDLRTS
jgi:pyruvate/2-oxoglutarate dehydrogenase complex dihydrolipoamide acyltransferase (E2) component